MKFPLNQVNKEGFTNVRITPMITHKGNAITIKFDILDINKFLFFHEYLHKGKNKKKNNKAQHYKLNEEMNI